MFGDRGGVGGGVAATFGIGFGDKNKGRVLGFVRGLGRGVIRVVGHFDIIVIWIRLSGMRSEEIGMCGV